MSKVFCRSLIRPSLTVTSAVAPSWCEHCTAGACCRGAWFQAHLDRLEDVGVDGDGEVLSGDGRVGLDGDVLELAAGQRYVPNNSSRMPVLCSPCLAQEAHRNPLHPTKDHRLIATPPLPPEPKPRQGEVHRTLTQHHSPVHSRHSSTSPWCASRRPAPPPSSRPDRTRRASWPIQRPRPRATRKCTARWPGGGS